MNYHLLHQIDKIHEVILQQKAMICLLRSTLIEHGAVSEEEVGLMIKRAKLIGSHEFDQAKGAYQGDRDGKWRA